MVKWFQKCIENLLNHQAALSSKGNDGWEEGERCAVVGVVVVQQLIQGDQGACSPNASTAVNQDGTLGERVDTLETGKKFVLRNRNQPGPW